MRESGILMPVSSLPGPYGIGCFGKEAFKFVDFLAQAGQKIWQILPLSPTGYGDSPYQSCSAFAGNPYFIDLDALKEEGLLTAAQLKAEKWGTDPKDGQKLVQMDAANLKQMKLQLENEETEFRRMDELYKVGGASKSEWDAAKTALDVRRTSYNNLLENTQLLSP